MKKSLFILFFVFLLIFLSLFIFEGGEGVDYKTFYGNAIDYNEQVIDLSRNIFENKKEIELKTYQVDELQLEVKDLQYFEDKYKEYGPGTEKDSPSTRLTSSNISLRGSRLIIELGDSASLGSVSDTGSMDPVDVGSNTIKIKPKSFSDIEVGDIITYRPNYSDTEIIHRVVKLGEDKDGLYVIAKGDNNPVSDPERIRFDQITGVLVAIIY
jgi:hypothetical protein